MRTLKFEKLKLHLIAWILFIAYERLYYFILGAAFANFWIYFYNYCLAIGLFYFNGHVVLPFTINTNKRNYLKLAVLVFAELVVYIAFKYLLIYLLPLVKIPLYPPFISNSSYTSNGIWRVFYIIGLSTGYWFALSTLQNRKRVDELEKINLEAELENQTLEKAILTTENAYLKSQINPHFLLNTLNFLYNSVAKYSEKVADSVMTLADIMRYALTNADADGKVKLESEIEQITNFVKLNQARFSQRLNIDLHIEGEPDELRIIPLVLITLVENVFKYADLRSEIYPAKIIINIDGSHLTFITQNLKKTKVTEQGHGIGINNVKKRLAMYHNYELTIEDNEKDYKSILKIEL